MPTDDERRGRGGGAGGRGAGRSERGRSARPAGDRSDRERSPRPSAAGRPIKPQLPDERPRLPREVFRELKATAREGTLDDVCSAFGAAGQALVDENPHSAIRYLQWAKSAAPRSAVIREALGVALYRSGNLEQARSELQSYRRLSGRTDQNHLLADCVRAQGRSAKVEEYIDEMLASGVPMERAAEGVIVLAGDRADRGDLEGALAALDRVDAETVTLDESRVRLSYMAADLQDRLGNREAARQLFAQVAEIDEDYLDVGERLSRND